MKLKVICLLALLVMSLVVVAVGQAQEETGMISGWAFVDQDKDGVRDPGEPGLPGTVICLVGYNWCDHTEWGEYMFDMRPPGKYRVEPVHFPDGYHLTTRRLFEVELQAGEIRNDVHFGLAEAEIIFLPILSVNLDPNRR